MVKSIKALTTSILHAYLTPLVASTDDDECINLFQEPTLIIKQVLPPARIKAKDLILYLVKAQRSFIVSSTRFVASHHCAGLYTLILGLDARLPSLVVN